MISVTILTKNSQNTLRDTLQSVQAFPEVLLIDTGSTDATCEIAKEFPNVKIYENAFLGFGKTHNLASSLASNDWILSIDSDEVVSEALAKEILSLSLNPDCVYFLDRHNFFNGKRMKYCGGWHPDFVARLYHRRRTCFTEASVHEKILMNGLRPVVLEKPLYHTPYREIADLLSKMQVYSTLFAQDRQSLGKSSLLKAIFHGWFAFFKSYILKKGFLGGREGYIISIYNSHTTFYKYLKLNELHHKRG